MLFEEACSEMNYILEHMNPIDKNMIPESVIEFFKENRSLTYRVKLTTDKKLEEQDLKDETKAFIKILYAKYFLDESQKRMFINQLQEPKEENNNIAETTKMVVYKENKILKVIRKFLNYFKVKGIFNTKKNK